MAQTKRATSSRSGGTSRNGASAKARPKRSTNGSRARGSASSAKRRSTSAQSRAKHTAKSKVEEAGSTVADVSRKAKTPLVAVGAAVAGIAGGAALATRRNGKSSAVKAFGFAAKEFGKAGYRLGQLTSEVRRVREVTTKS